MSKGENLPIMGLQNREVVHIPPISTIYGFMDKIVQDNNSNHEGNKYVC